jgi:hypothetical protein
MLCPATSRSFQAVGDEDRQKKQEPGENDEAPGLLFKFFQLDPMREVTFLSTHWTTSFLAGKEVIPSTLSDLAGPSQQTRYHSTPRFKRAGARGNFSGESFELAMNLSRGSCRD